jgi:oligoendopeptidase F
MTAVYPSPGSRQFSAAQEALGASLTRVITVYDRHAVRAGEPHVPSAEEVGAFEEVLDVTNDLHNETRTLTAYLHAFVTTDASDTQAARLMSQLQSSLTDAQRLAKRFEGWVATLGAENLIAKSTLAADHAYPLRRAERAATHQMTEDEEGLYAELNLTGGTAWNRLHGEFTAGLSATVGDRADLPMTVVRGLATDPDAAVRRAAYDAELAAWEKAAVPLAAALNAIKGEANAINRRRGWTNSLEPALWANGVDAMTLGAMQEAAVASFPDYRRYLGAKARLLGQPGPLPWWDMWAPVGRAPVGRAPVGVAPVGRAPVGSAPVGSAPVGRAPVGRAPARWTGKVPSLA